MKKRTLFLSFLLTLSFLFILAACGKDEPEESNPTTVEEVVFSVSLNSSTKSIAQGDSFILVATLNGITEYDSVGWAADGDLLQITPNGLNAVITAGATTGTDTISITVTKDDVSETASCVVTVNPVLLTLSVESENITLVQGESTEITLTVDPIKTETIIEWEQSDALLTIEENGSQATITAGAATGTTTLSITASIYGLEFVKDITVTVNEIVPYVMIDGSEADVNVDEEIVINLDFLTAYQSDKSFAVSVSSEGFVLAEITENDQLSITGVQEGEVTVTVTMTTNDIEYQDTIIINVRPLGYVSISDNVYDPFDLQLNFTESLFFSSIDESIWQQYNILFGAADNQSAGDLRGQFVFKLSHMFGKDGDKDVIQVMPNGMSAMAIRIPDTIDQLAAIEFSMDVTTLDPTYTGQWRMEFYIATVIEDQTVLYARANSENNALLLGNLIIPAIDLLRDGYHTYRFYVNSTPENAGNYIVIYFGNTGTFVGTEEDRTMIEGFNFLSKEQTDITLTTPPTKLEYVVGQMFDPTDMVVSGVYTLGNDVPINHDDLMFNYDFSTPGEKVVTITYGDYSLDVNVTVIEKVISSLELTQAPSKVIYTEGEVFDPTGMIVTAIYNDGEEVVVDDYQVSSDPLVAGTTMIYVSYSGLNLSVPITVNAAALVSIAVTQQPTKIEYVVGQSANYSGIVITATYADASTEVIPFSALVFSGFNSSMPAVDQVITVTYGGQTTTFMIHIIARAILSINVQSYPQVTYLVGEEANWSGLAVVAVYNDNTTEAIDFAELTLEGYNSAVAGTVTITVTYLTFSTTFTVNITEDQGHVAVLVPDMNFDTEGLEANVTMYTDLFSGETPRDRSNYDLLLGRVLNDTERNLQYATGIYLSGEGLETKIVVQTNGMSAIAIRIPDGLSASDITAFSFSMSAEGTPVANTVTFRPSFRFSSIYDGVEYFHAMATGTYSLDQSAAMTIVYDDYSRVGYHDYTVVMEMPELDEGVTLGNYILMYMGNNGSFRDSSLSSLNFNGFKFWTRDVVSEISLTSEPTKTTYVVGESFDPTGLVVTPLYGINIYNAPVTLNNADLNFDYDFSTAGEKVVTISYAGLTLQVMVTVVEKAITSLDVTTLPNKVIYNEGELFDPTGMVVTATYNDGSTEEITTYTYPTEPLVGGTEMVEIGFDGLTANVTVEVIAATLDSIAVTQMPTKVEFVVGQLQDFTGLVVTATYSDLSTRELTLEELSFSGFDSSVVIADQVITITFEDQTTTFMIDIIERVVTSISIQSYPQVTYIQGEEANWSGLAVIANFNDDSTEAVDFASLVITGFNSTVAGEITITVAYMTFEATFNVTITEAAAGFVEISTVGMDFVTDGLVANTTMYTDLFSGETPADQANYDVLLGRTLNDAERNLQYSTAIYFSGEGAEAIIVVQTNGMSAMAVRIPDSISAADITAFSFSMSGEHITTLADTVTFKPSFRFSSIYDGVEYFHTTNTGTYSLPQSGALTITQPDFTRVGYHDYTVQIETPALEVGESLGNYLIIYMGNNGNFRDSTLTSLYFNGFKFWTNDVVTDASLTSGPTQVTYEIGQVFNSEGLVITPVYSVDIYGAPTEVNHSNLVFDYDFSVAGETQVTITYLTFTFTVQVTVVEPTEP